MSLILRSPLQQAVQEINQQILVNLLPEYQFEPHIRKRVDKLSHKLFIFGFHPQSYAIFPKLPTPSFAPEYEKQGGQLPARPLLISFLRI